VTTPTSSSDLGPEDDSHSIPDDVLAEIDAVAPLYAEVTE